MWHVLPCRCRIYFSVPIPVWFLAFYFFIRSNASLSSLFIRYMCLLYFVNSCLSWYLVGLDKLWGTEFLYEKKFVLGMVTSFLEYILYYTRLFYLYEITCKICCFRIQHVTKTCTSVLRSTYGCFKQFSAFIIFNLLILTK